MANIQKAALFVMKIVFTSILLLMVSPAGQSTQKDEKDNYPKDLGEKTMSSIPKEYGCLVDVNLFYPDRKHHIAELWFEDQEGTLRIVTVDKGKSPDDQPRIDDRIRVIPRKGIDHLGNNE